MWERKQSKRNSFLISPTLFSKVGLSTLIIWRKSGSTSLAKNLKFSLRTTNSSSQNVLKMIEKIEKSFVLFSLKNSQFLNFTSKFKLFSRYMLQEEQQVQLLTVEMESLTQFLSMKDMLFLMQLNKFPLQEGT